MLAVRQAHGEAKPGDCVVGWQLDAAQRSDLLARFPPKYARVAAHHIALNARVSRRSPLPPQAVGEIVGRSDDGRGLEAMVVRIAGSILRPGGGTYHITWSVAEGRRARESDRVIASHRWEPVEPPVAVSLRPGRWR